MSKRILPFIPQHFVVERVLPHAAGVSIVCRTRRLASRCPTCRSLSARTHSHYERRIADLPWQGRSVTLCFQARRLRCGNRRCARRTFTERAEDAVRPHARGTLRLREIQRSVGLALGGEAGARLVERLGMRASADTMLRMVRSRPSSLDRAPRILGVDDWAWRRGQRYGTVLVDLETNRVVDLLPDRDSATLADWLATHPGTEIIARDRAGAYAQGARQGAPGARQVADRWHMLRNCSDALLDAVEKRHRLVREVGASLAADRDGGTSGRLVQLPEAFGMPKASRQRRDGRAARQAMYDSVVALRQRGWSLTAIRRETGHDRKTVRKWLDDKRPGSWQRRKASAHPADAFSDYLRQRWDEGCRNATQLYREVCERGYLGHARNFRRWVKIRLRDAVPASAAPAGSRRPRRKPPSSRVAARLLTAPDERLSRDERAFVDALRAASPSLAATADLARRFHAMLVDRDVDALDRWLAAALDSPLASFARGLRRDIDAVRAALTMRWSTGPVEGKINKLKLIKRSMYGRAHLDLLRARIMA
jgi:transposase